MQQSLRQHRHNWANAMPSHTRHVSWLRVYVTWSPRLEERADSLVSATNMASLQIRLGVIRKVMYGARLYVRVRVVARLWRVTGHHCYFTVDIWFHMEDVLRTTPETHQQSANSTTYLCHNLLVPEAGKIKTWQYTAHQYCL